MYRATVSAAYNNDTLKDQRNPSKFGLDNFFNKKIMNEFFSTFNSIWRQSFSVSSISGIWKKKGTPSSAHRANDKFRGFSI